MVKKKIVSNSYFGTGFLSPKGPSPFIIGKTKGPSKTNFNFFPMQKKVVKSKQVNSFKVTPIQFFAPHSKTKGKGIGMNWYNSKQKKNKNSIFSPFAGHPFKDSDKDKVIDIFDCSPHNPKKDSFIGNIGKAASSAVQSVAKAVAPVTKAVSKTYTSIDKSIGGILPGGAAVSAPVKAAVTKAVTTVAAVSKATGGAVGIGSGGIGLVSAQTAVKAVTPTAPEKTTTTSSTPSLITPTLNLLPTATASNKNKSGATTSTIIPAVSLGSTRSIDYTDLTGTSIGTATITGKGAWEEPIPTMTVPPKTPAPSTPRYSEDPYYVAKQQAPAEVIQYETSAPLTIKGVQALLQPISQRVIRPETEKTLPTIAGAVEIDPEQLIYLTKDRYAKYPLILNLNPYEKKRPAYVNAALMKLNPRITYNPNLPTRLSIIAPIGTTKEMAMTNIGAPGGKYAEYVIKMPSA